MDAILSVYFNSWPDPQRNEKIAADNFPYIERWYNSVDRLRIHAVVFHDGLSASFVKQYSTERIQFIPVPTLDRNPVDAKWTVVSEHLKKHRYNRVFVTDISDVEVRTNPFTQDALWEDFNLFCGDEPEFVGCPWLSDLVRQLDRQEWWDWHQCHASEILLNAGVLGGYAWTVALLATEVANCLERWIPSSIMADMLLVNIVARKLGGTRLRHGHPVNSRFKAYETCQDVWFAHK